MSVANWFQEFCSNLRMDDNVINNVSARYKQITKRINLDYWDSDSETNNSLFVGSYGRGTAIHVSDIDIIVHLPYSTYERFNNYYGNGQSAWSSPFFSVKFIEPPIPYSTHILFLFFVVLP